MDSLKFLLYTLKSVGIMLVLNVFAVVCGRIFFPLIASFLPGSEGALNEFFTASNSGSFVGWLVMLIFLAVLFYDDGKRHAAYEYWSSVNVTITLLFMLLIYFVPAIFRDSFASEGKGDVFYALAYFPCKWLNDGAGLEYTLSVALGIGIILVCLFLVYLIAFKLYVKKHPVILSRYNYTPDEQEETEAENADE